MKKSLVAIMTITMTLVLSLSALTACGGNKHEFSDEWKKDESYHWHECTKKKHTDTTEKTPHEFKEEIVKAADYGVEGEKKFTCTVCEYSYTEGIDAVDAKDNEIKLAEGKMLDKTYDGKVVDTTGKFSFNGDGAVTVMFKVTGAADDTYTADAPKNAGEYTVKVSVKDTAEWKAATQTFDFEIAKKELTGAAATKAYDGNATIEATPDGVVAGDAVTATITMTSKNIDATVQSVMLEGADKDNYLIDKTDVVASITKKDITEDIPNMNYFYNGTTSLFLYNGSTGSYGTIYGDAVIIRVIFASKDVGTTNITGVSISGTDGGNYRIDHTKLSGTIIQTSLELVGINFKIFKFGDNYYSVPLKVTEDHVDMSGFNDDVTIKMIKYNGTHAIGDTWTLTNADSDCFEITGADAKNYKKVMFSDDEGLACTATLAVDESMPELTNAVYNKEIEPGTYWYKKELGAGYKTLDYAQSKMKITVYKSDGNKATVIDNEMLVPDQTTIYLYIEVREEASRGPRVTNSTTHAELTIGTTYELPKAPNTNNLGKKHFLKVKLPQNGYYQITKQKFYISDNISFYDETGKKINPLICTNRTYDSVNNIYSDYIYTIANFSDSEKVIYISITVHNKESVNGITVSSAKSYTVSETGKYLRYETKYLSAQLPAGKITINENNSTVLSERKLTYKVYGADLKAITMNADGTFEIPAKGKYLIEVSNLTEADIESVTFKIVTAS